MDAIHIQPYRWVVHVLGNIDLGDVRQAANARGQVLGNVVRPAQFATRNLHVDGGGHAHIQNGVHHGTAGEEGAQIGIFGGNLAANAVHVFEAADLVRFLQSNLNGGGVRAGIGRIQRREIGNDADIGNHHVEVGWVHDMADQVLDFGG